MSDALAGMQRAVQLAGFNYIACLKARPTNQDSYLTLGKHRFDFAGIARSETPGLHAEFQRWAANAVLRDLIESFSIFLYEIFKQQVAAGPTPARTAPDRFERMGVEDQLLTLAKAVTIDPAWIDLVIGYNRARNCLAHRNGIVGSRDVNEDGKLAIRWLDTQVSLSTGPAEATMEVRGNLSHLIRAVHVSGERGVEVSSHVRVKRVGIGEQIGFAPEDVLSIISTFQIVSGALDGIGAPTA